MILAHGNWKAEIWENYGMNTVSLKYMGEEILRRPDSEEILKNSPFTYGLPLQFPANRVKDGCFYVDRKAYSLPVNEEARHCHIHGFLAVSSFEITEQTGCSVKAEFINEGKVFPLPFKLDVEFYLDESGYHQLFAFENTGGETLPLSFGLHSSFRAQKLFSVGTGGRLERDSQLMPTGVILPLNTQDEKIRGGCCSSKYNIGDEYEIAEAYAVTGRFRYTVSDNFSHWMLWNNGPDSGFMCIEPQCGAANSLNNHMGCIFLEGGKTETFRTDIALNSYSFY